MMKLRQLFERKPEAEQVLYEAIVAAARQPAFYEGYGVPDTVDGRFDMIALNMFLILERLRTDAPETFRQRLIDVFFRDMDRSLREMGVGDLSVGKKVRKMAEAFYGRLLAYQQAAEIGREPLADALARNIYAGQDASQAPDLANWVLAARSNLQNQDVHEIQAGRFELNP